MKTPRAGTTDHLDADAWRPVPQIYRVIRRRGVPGIGGDGPIDIWFSYQEQRASLVRSQREQAEAAAARIGQFVKEIENQMGWMTQLPWSASTLEEWRFDAVRLLHQVPAITELARIDAKGREQARMSRVTASGRRREPIDLSQDPKFLQAMASKRYNGPVYFRRVGTVFDARYCGRP
jgi:hypothetical protein